MRDRKPYQRYSPDFRHDAVQLVMSSDETLRAVADRLGVNYWTLRGWYREAMRKKRTSKRVSESQPRENETAEERLARVEAENIALRKRNAELETDKAILKKAAAFFARESN